MSVLSPLDQPVRGAHVQAGRGRTSGQQPLPQREPDLEGGRHVGVVAAAEAAQRVAVVPALEEDVENAAVEAAGLPLGLLRHVTGDHVEEALRKGQTTLEDVDPGAQFNRKIFG